MVSKDRSISQARKQIAEWNQKRDDSLFSKVCDNAKAASERLSQMLIDINKMNDQSVKDEARKIMKAVLTGAINNL